MTLLRTLSSPWASRPKLTLVSSICSKIGLLALTLNLAACSSNKASEAPKPVQLDETQLIKVFDTQLNDALNQQKHSLIQAMEYQTRIIEQKHSELLNQIRRSSISKPRLSSVPTQETLATCNRPENSKPIMGELEHVYLSELQTSFIGRVDTGVNLSSLAVHNLILFKRNREQWARFDVYTRGPQAPALSYEAKVERFERVDTQVQNPTSETKRVPIIYSQFKVGQHSKSAEVMLSQFEQPLPLILGRDFIKGFALIDPQKKYNLGRVSP